MSPGFELLSLAVALAISSACGRPAEKTIWQMGKPDHASLEFNQRWDFSTTHDGALDTYPLAHGVADLSNRIGWFPLRNGGDVKADYETHNAVTQRPDGIYDAQTWVDAEIPTRGMALINKGTGGHITENGTLKLILLRSITNYRGYYCPKASGAGSHTFK